MLKKQNLGDMFQFYPQFIGIKKTQSEIPSYGSSHLDCNPRMIKQVAKPDKWGGQSFPLPWSFLS